MNKTEVFINKIITKNNPNHFNKDGSLRYNYSKTLSIKGVISEPFETDGIKAANGTIPKVYIILLHFFTIYYYLYKIRE